MFSRDRNLVSSSPLNLSMATFCFSPRNIFSQTSWRLSLANSSRQCPDSMSQAPEQYRYWQSEWEEHLRVACFLAGLVFFSKENKYFLCVKNSCSRYLSSWSK